MQEKMERARNLLGKAIEEGVGSSALEIKEVLADLVVDLDTFCEFELLKGIIESEEWPGAVYGVQIADENSEKDKDERAEGIMDIVLPPLQGKRFLDFGCGEGHVAARASKLATVSVGYDITRNPRSSFDWEKDSDNLLLTTDFESVRSGGPYDIILLYDVLDHAHNSTPQEILSSAASVLADGGKIYLRNHPWCSRHGGHAYRKINKAFVHLVFDEDELRSMGIEVESNMHVTRPVATYNAWIEGAGLKNSTDPDFDLQDVEPFFKENPLVAKRILKAFDIKEWGDTPSWQMSQCFVDFVLEKK
jgi:2-polyprenyl-3-methyl-5-hydroxy-6-metoxy-1,4-benzoquinol methylase